MSVEAIRRTPAKHQYNVHEAKTHLSHILEEVEAGEEVIISRAGRPIARLQPVSEEFTPRAPGPWRGKVTIHEDFDELDPDVAAAFNGEDP